MARVSHTAAVAVENGSSGVAVTFTTADTTNKEQTTLTGREIIIAHNSGAAPATVTVTSTADPYGRTGDITADSIAASAYAVYGPFGVDAGWQQTNGYLYFEASSTDIAFTVIRVPE